MTLIGTPRNLAVSHAYSPSSYGISDRRIIHFFRYIRVQSNAIQRIAEKKEIPQLRVVKRPDSEMISRAKQLLAPRVPDTKRKIAAQMVHASRAPRGICVQDQLGIRSSGLQFVSASLKFL